MKAMPKRKLSLFLALLVSFTLIYSSIGYFLLSKPPAEPFIGLGIYSEEGSLSNYYSTSNAPNITVGKSLNWHFQIDNRMGSIQLAKIVYRLANANSLLPNETAPSNAVETGETAMFIPNLENSTLPFNWVILSTRNSSGLTYLTIQINGQRNSPSVGAVLGQPPAGFRFIFELWTLNQQTGSFEYISSNRPVGNWLEVWFDVASS